jgi:hypothetical protein
VQNVIRTILLPCNPPNTETFENAQSAFEIASAKALARIPIKDTAENRVKTIVSEAIEILFRDYDRPLVEIEGEEKSSHKRRYEIPRPDDFVAPRVASKRVHDQTLPIVKRTKDRRRIAKGISHNANPLASMIREYTAPNADKQDVFALWLRNTSGTLSKRYVAKALEHSHDLRWLQRDLADVASSALGEYIAVVGSPTSHVSEKDFVLRIMPVINSGAIVHALRAMDSLRRKMAMTEHVLPAYFDVWDENEFVTGAEFGADDWSAPEHTHNDCRAYSKLNDVPKYHVIRDARSITYRNGESELAHDLVRARAEGLLSTVNDQIRTTKSKRQLGHLRQCRKLVLRGYKLALCSIKSRVFTFKKPLAFHALTETIVHRENGMRVKGHASHVMSTGKVVTTSALWWRTKKIGETIGVNLTPPIASKAPILDPIYVTPRDKAKDRREMAVARIESGAKTL